MHVKDLMTPVRNVDADAPLRQALSQMVWGEQWHLVAERHGDPVGLLCDADVLSYEVADSTSAPLEAPVSAAMKPLGESVAASATVADARALLDRHGASALTVTDDAGDIVGIVTCRGLLASGLATDPRPAAESLPGAAKLMAESPATATPREPLYDAVVRMVERRIRHLPVISQDGRLVGLLSDRDVRTALGDPLTAISGADARLRLASINVGQVMTKDVVTVGVDAEAGEIARLLVRRQIGAVPVVDDDGMLRGMVSYVDFVRWVGAA